jgi:hypothetical protein
MLGARCGGFYFIAVFHSFVMNWNTNVLLGPGRK